MSQFSIIVCTHILHSAHSIETSCQCVRIGMHTCYYIYMYSLPTLYAHYLAVHTPLHIFVYEHTARLHIHMYNLHTLHIHYKQYVHSLHTVCTVPCRYTLPTHYSHSTHTHTALIIYALYKQYTHPPHICSAHTPTYIPHLH